MAAFKAELERIYRRYRQQLFTVALAVTRCAERAEDAVQEAFCRLIRLEVKPRDLKVYVFRAVRNAALDQCRGKKHLYVEDATLFFEATDASTDETERKEFIRAVDAALLTLSENERETIVERLYAELTFREMARLRGEPPSTVAAWYYNGLKKLRAKLERSAWTI